MRTTFFVTMTLMLTVYGQIMIKWRVLQHADRTGANNAAAYLFTIFTDIWVLSGFAAAVVAGVCWVLALRGAALSFVYPFMALSFVLVPVFAAWLLDEKINVVQVAGMAMIVGGVSLATAAQ